MVKQFDTVNNAEKKIQDKINYNSDLNNDYGSISYHQSSPIRLEKSTTDQTTPTLKRNSSLRAQLLRTILPAVLVPLGLAGWLNYLWVSQSSQQRTQELLKGEAVLAGEVLRELLKLEALIPATVAANPLVIDAARRQSIAAAKESLHKKPIEEVETFFSNHKLLEPHQELQAYLSKTAEIGNFAELFFTDKHGFNVAYSNLTSDFVQRDEPWWENTKESISGREIGAEFDESANTYGIAFRQSLIDPASGEFLGVVKGIVPASWFSNALKGMVGDLELGRSQIVHLLASSSDGKVRVIDTINSGVTIDFQEEVTDATLRQNISTLIEQAKEVKSKTGAREKKTNQRALKLESIPTQSALNLWLAQFEHNSRLYLLVKVPGTNWVISSSLELGELQAAAKQNALTFSLVWLMVGAIITVAITFLSHQLVTPLQQLAGTAQQVATGNLDVIAHPIGSTETQTLAISFNNLVVRVKELLQKQVAETFQAQLFADITTAGVKKDLAYVFARSVEGAKNFLAAERVVIYGFGADSEGKIFAEAVDSAWPRAKSEEISDSCLSGKILEEYRKGRVVYTSDVLAANYSPEHLQLLKRLEVKANLVTPIVAGENLLGLLIAHQCSSTRVWQRSEIEFLEQLAAQVGLSLTSVHLVAQKADEAQRAQQLNELISRLRESLQVEDIYNAAVSGIRESLATDRVLVYLFDQNWQGTIVAESVGRDWPSSLGAKITDPCFAEQYLEKYKRGRVKATADITRANLSQCHLSQLEPFKVRASLVAPILVYQELKGLLVTHQCSSTRNWQESEINFLKQMAIQVGFALDQTMALEEKEQARINAELVCVEQRRQREELQLQLLELLSEVEGAAQGDLTVRADVGAGEIGTVADFFNAVIESLRAIVTKVKTAAKKVNTSLEENKGAIHQLSEEALQQAQETTSTLDSLQFMTLSIQEVAQNARQAAVVARQAFTNAEMGGIAIDRSVQNILSLRETVAETAKKVKRLGESSQQISKVVSLINQIALQTNLLAINAGIEAARAGEEGQGFVVVAEEVGELAARSAAATQEIEQIVDNIQQETLEVVSAMEKGTTQVVEGTHLVEDAKQSLSKILEVSRQIDQLVQLISSATVSQVETSQAVTELMEEIAKVSEQTSHSTRLVSSSLQETVEIAQELQASVGRFNVGE